MMQLSQTPQDSQLYTSNAHYCRCQKKKDHFPHSFPKLRLVHLDYPVNPSSYLVYISLELLSCRRCQFVEAELGKQGVHGDPLATALVEILIDNTFDSAKTHAVVLNQGEYLFTVLA